jgi:Ni/Fe-hydrogenase subunit HybB-like protein
LGTLFVIMTERVHPLWYTPLLPLLFFLSSVASGVAMVVAGGTVSYWVFKRSLPQKLVGDLAKFIPWMMGVYGVIRLGELIYSGDILMLRYQNLFSVLFMIEFLVLVVVPIVLFAMPSVRESRGVSFFAAAMLLGGVFLNRFNIAWFTLRPVEGFSYFPSFSEIAIQVGVLSAIIIVYTLIGHYFPLFEGLYASEQKAPVSHEALQVQPAY